MASFMTPVAFEAAGVVLVVVGTAVAAGVTVDVAFPPIDAVVDGVAAGEAAALVEFVEAVVDVGAVVAVVFETDKNSRGFEASANRRAVKFMKEREV